MTIRCFYSCHACKLEQQFVEVPERDPDQLDIVRWIQEVAIPTMVADHTSKSPLCRPGKMFDIGIPIDDGTEHVGQRTRS